VVTVELPMVSDEPGRGGEKYNLASKMAGGSELPFTILFKRSMGKIYQAREKP